MRLEFASATALNDARRVLPEAVADPVLLTLTADTDGRPRRWRLCWRPSTDTGSRCAAWRRVRPSLDDVFLTLTERRPVAA